MSISLYQPNGIYTVRSFSSANTLYFENLNDHRLFFRYVNYFLSDYIDILEYVLIPTGWAMIFRTKSSQEIQNAYQKRLLNSVRKRKRNLSNRPDLIISEQFRLLISQYVKNSNAIHGRTGSKIHSRMQKHVLPDENAFLREKEKMEALEEFSMQHLRRYHPMMQYYKNGEIEKNEAYRSSNGSRAMGVRVLCNMIIGDLPLFVVRNWISITLTNHSLLPSSNSS